MTVYKKYLKIANTYALLILTYSAIFLGLAIFAGTYNSTSTDYESMDVKVAIVNRDKNTELINALGGNNEVAITTNADMILETKNKTNIAVTNQNKDYIKGLGITSGRGIK